MSEARPIRVAVAADRAIIRKGLLSLLTGQKHIQLVGEASDGVEALQLAELVQPDVILLDLHQPAETCRDLTRLIHQRLPQGKVVWLLNMKEEEAFQSDPEAGDFFYLSKDITEDAFSDALLQISRERPHTPGEAGATQAEVLQQLTAELKGASVDRTSLVALLRNYLPVIFPDAYISIRIFPNQELLSHPAPVSNPLVEAAFRWLRTTHDPRIFVPGQEYPWGSRQEAGSALLLAPVLRSRQPVGGISILMANPPGDTSYLLPLLQTLAGQVLVVLNATQTQAQKRPGELLARELHMAGKIQADILPERAPVIPGWDIAAHLESARETSGDFYDFIPLTSRDWGIVIADVTDKGMGAALFMALSNTLIRTFATRYPTLPALAMGAVNERILTDTRGNMFVTAFYGVLDPDLGRLRFVNAGHPPPFLISTAKGKPFDRLRPTGMALGVMETAHWQQKIITMKPGDMLLLYTDGVTEAMNTQGQFFGEQRLMDIFRARGSCTAKEILATVLDAVHDFVGDAPQHDDIAIVVICRKEHPA